MVSVSSESMVQDFEVTPFVGYRAGGTLGDSLTGFGLDIKNSESYGVVLGYRTSLHTMVEILAFNHQSTALRPKGLFSQPSIIDLNVDYYHLGGTYIWRPEKRLRPFLQASLGATLFSPDRADLESEFNFSFGLGGGIKFFIIKHIGLRLDARALGTVQDKDSPFFCSSGCTTKTQGNILWQYQGSLGIIFAF